MNLIAFDLSLTAPGICYPDGETETLRIKDKGLERLRFIRHQVITRTLVRDPLVLIEGYSFGSKGAAVINIGELGGVVRLALWEANVPFVEIPPSCLKKYATGRGNAGKEDVLQAAVIRSGHTFPDNNAADAWWLHQMGLAHYAPESPLLVKVPQLHREGLAKVQWVDVGERAA